MQQLDADVLSQYLTPNGALKISEALLGSADTNAKMLGRYINDSLPQEYFDEADTHFPIDIAAAAAPEESEILDAAVRDVTSNGKSIPRNTYTRLFQNVQNWGLALLREYFTEIRHKLCGKGKQSKPMGATANSALAALGTAVAQLLGIAKPLGVGIAVLVITNAARVGKTALCKMTTEQQLAKYFA